MFDDSPEVAQTEATASDQIEFTQSVAAVAGWRIDFKLYPNMLKTGNEAILIFQELAKRGELQVDADTSVLPELDSQDLDQCYLGWQLVLQGDIERHKVEELFERLEGGCEHEISALDLNSSVLQKPRTVESELQLALSF